ncbi:MAG: hypothetical protein WC044_00075 [Crocinitomicaceae bacterium]
MKKYSLFFFILAFSVATISLMGCNKKKDTIAKIYIRNSANAVVSGAKVILYGESSEPGQQGKVNVGDTTISNAAGEAIFNLNDLYQKGQAGVAVLNISAKKSLETGSGIIKIVEEETNEETVFIQ